MRMGCAVNDFTKEELEYLHSAIYERPSSVTLQMDEMRNKIQSMIDNYCEHDFDMTDWVNDSSGCRWYECKKCQRLYR